jgi:ABC-type branched-subunit amino acid transport system substrate-binding protein
MYRISKKSLVASIISVFLIIALTACSSGKDAATNSSSANAGPSAVKTNSVQGVTDTEILVGHTAPQTGNQASYDGFRKGILSYFNYVNNSGGVNGRKFKLIAYDDEDSPNKAVKNVKRLVEEDKVFALLGSPGSVKQMAVKEYYTEKGIPVVMTNVGVRQFVDPVTPNIMGVGVLNYFAEAQIFLDYAVTKLNAKKIAIAYENDDIGKSGQGTIKEKIKNYPGVSIVAEVPFLSTDVDFSSQAQKLQQANPDVIMMFGTSAPAANLKKAMYKIGLKNVPYITTFAGGNDVKMFQLAGPDVWEGTISSTPLVQPELSSAPNAKVYVEQFKKDWPNDVYTSGPAMSGWACAEIFVEAVKRAGNDLSWDHFLQTFYTFDKWKGSLFSSITFTKDNHYGVSSAVLTLAKDGKLVPLTGVINYDPVTDKITSD